MSDFAEARRLLRPNETLTFWTDGGREDSTVPDLTTWTVGVVGETVHPDCDHCSGHMEHGNVLAGFGRNLDDALTEALTRLRERDA